MHRDMVRMCVYMPLEVWVHQRHLTKDVQGVVMELFSGNIGSYNYIYHQYRCSYCTIITAHTSLLLLRVIISN